MQEASVALRSAEMPLVALQINMLAGDDLREICTSATGADVLKLRCLQLSTNQQLTVRLEQGTDRANVTNSRGCKKRKHRMYGVGFSVTEPRRTLTKLLKVWILGTQVYL